jgi:large subunit ribosomal protein L14
LKVSDNSGAKIAKCIKIFGGFKRRTAVIGDTVLVSIKELRENIPSNNKIKKGQIYKAIVIRTKKVLCKKNNIFIFFNDNSVILLDKKGNPIATRIIGPVPKFLKNENLKIKSISNGFI